MTVIAVVDRSQSIPANLQNESHNYLTTALAQKDSSERLSQDRLAIVNVAEVACIAQLPSIKGSVSERETTLKGHQTRLSDGIQMAMAIAPPDTATRLLLVLHGSI